MITLAPCSLSSSAVARPMPRAEPVTIATLSSRTPMAEDDSRGSTYSDVTSRLEVDLRSEWCSSVNVSVLL